MINGLSFPNLKVLVELLPKELRAEFESEEN